MTRVVHVAAVVALLLFAGCAGIGIGGDSPATPAQTTSQQSSDDSSQSTQSSADSFSAHFTTDVVAGDSATLVVTDSSGDPVADATVRVDGTNVGTTNADGTLTIDVPQNDDAIEVQVAKSGDETEFTKAVQSG